MEIDSRGCGMMETSTVPMIERLSGNRPGTIMASPAGVGAVADP